MKKMLGTIMAIAMLLSTTVSATVVEPELNNDVSESGYAETHFQVNFKDYNVEVAEGKLKVTEKTPIMTCDAEGAETDNLNKLESIFAEFPDVEDNLIRDYQAEGLIAASFTEIPLEYVDGHYERARNYASSDNDKDRTNKGKFVMYTTITGGQTAYAGGYRYTANTYGSWSNDMAGGSNYPDKGEDYIFQTSPNTFSRASDSITVEYDASPTTGVSGDDYWKENGDATYVRYAVLDDPLGYRQCKSIKLTTVSSGPKSSNLRQIGSYYVHTWEEMSINVSVDISTAKSVTLSISPTNIQQSWQAYNYVAFDF